MAVIAPVPVASAWWIEEWERRHACRWQPIGNGNLVPMKPILGSVIGPRRLPEGNESVRAIRAIEAQIASLVMKETTE